MVLAAFLARHIPVSTSANPDCMNMTRNPASSVQTKFNDWVTLGADAEVSAGAGAGLDVGAAAARCVQRNRRMHNAAQVIARRAALNAVPDGGSMLRVMGANLNEPDQTAQVGENVRREDVRREDVRREDVKEGRTVMVVAV
jgi:hypothetical protein